MRAEWKRRLRLLIPMLLLAGALGILKADDVRVEHGDPRMTRSTSAKELASARETAASPPRGASREKESASGEAVDVRLLDLEVTDQDGSVLHFSSDVIGDRVAVVAPFYTTCTTTFPILIYTFSQLQGMLVERLGRDVVLVSVSVDPQMDVPARLKAFARRRNAGAGWVFLTGDRDSLGQILWAVGALDSPNLEAHNHIPVTLIGRAGGKWRRYHGFPSPAQIAAGIRHAQESRIDGH